MAQIILTIPDNIVQRVLNSFCARKGYTGFESDGTTPISKIDFAKKDLANYIKNIVAQQESIEASNLASNNAQADVEQNIVID
jgi:hypothetical protein